MVQYEAATVHFLLSDSNHRTVVKWIKYKCSTYICKCTCVVQCCLVVRMSTVCHEFVQHLHSAWPNLLPSLRGAVLVMLVWYTNTNLMYIQYIMSFKFKTLHDLSNTSPVDPNTKTSRSYFANIWSNQWWISWCSQQNQSQQFCNVIRYMYSFPSGVQDLLAFCQFCRIKYFSCNPIKLATQQTEHTWEPTIARKVAPICILTILH